MVAPADAVDMTENLPQGNYIVKFDPHQGFYLETAEGFTLPKKVYGNCSSHAKRILSTFHSRGKNTGVVLSGEKGSGKTLLARKVSIDSGMPVLIINSQFTGDNFNSFLSSITQQCVVFFDEFEKIYDKEHQEKILTLLDGTYQSQKLFVITSNDKWRIDAHMRNRPGRIFYMIEFGGLNEKFIREYCEDKLLPQYQNMIEKILETSELFDIFNFDLLVAFVEEINRYGQEPKDIIPILNAKPEYGGDIEYEVQMYIRDIKVLPVGLGSNAKVFLNPTREDFEVSVFFHWSKENSEISEFMRDTDSFDTDKLYSWIKSGDVKFGRKTSDGTNVMYSCLNFEFMSDDIVEYMGSSVVFLNDDKVKAVLTRYRKKSMRAYI
jgi:hypothetical protein